MPDLLDENRIRDSSAENDAPATPTVSMKSSMRYCLEGREDAGAVFGSVVDDAWANAAPDSVEASRMASRTWRGRMDGVMRGPRGEWVADECGASLAVTRRKPGPNS